MTDSTDIPPTTPRDPADLDRGLTGAGPEPAVPETGTATPPSEPPPPRTLEGLTRHGKVRSTRMSAWWAGLIIAAVLLVLLLIFIAQNSRDVTVHYLGFHGQVSLAIALLLSAVAGVLLVAVPGSARIMQLRRALRRNASQQTGHRPTTRKRR